MTNRAFKSRLSVGQRVKFYRSHDKAHQLVGKIVKIHSGEADVVDVEFEKDGKLVEVTGHVETVHAADVEVHEIQPARTIQRPADPKPGDSGTQPADTQ